MNNNYGVTIQTFKTILPKENADARVEVLRQEFEQDGWEYISKKDQDDGTAVLVLRKGRRN